MATTANYGLPYPGRGDDADGQADIEALAEAVDTQLARLDGRFTSIEGRSTSPPALAAGNGTHLDVPGTSVTFSTDFPNAVVLVTAVWDMSCGSTAGATTNHIIGYLSVDGVEQGPQALMRVIPNDRATVGQVYRITLPAAGQHTIKQRCSTSATTGTVAVNSPHTGWTGLIIDGG